MPWLIGMDEAGYGPTLGPLVVTATVWEVPDTSVDLWKVFASVTEAKRTADTDKIHVADSKLVYRSGEGLKRLETSVWSLLALRYDLPESFVGLWKQLVEPSLSDASPPWYDWVPRLPVEAEREAVAVWTDRLAEAGRKAEVRLHAVRCCVISSAQFNTLLEQFGNKSRLLSFLSSRLLKNVWSPLDRQVPTLVVADKHGGRNRYDEFLQEMLDGDMYLCLDCGRELSRYRTGKTDLRFEPKAERYFPVAAASLVSKYLRELVMEGFNRFWRQYKPELKPTKGYPQDAKRFKQEIVEVQRQLQLPDHVLYRRR